MTDYNPLEDFWGDIINGVAVAIIATRLSSSNTENRNYKTEDMNDETEDKIDNTEVKFDKLAEVMDDIIIMGSLHAINVYLFITWWEHIYNDKIIVAFAFIALIPTYLFIIIIKNYYKSCNIIIPFNATFLFFEILNFSFWPNYNSIANPFDEFCVNEYSYRNCMNDKEIRKIIFKLIMILMILSPSIMDLSEFLNSNENSVENSAVKIPGARILRLILFTIIIILQSVENGYLLSNNFWQTIIRLFDIYRNDSPSVYASVFGLDPNYDKGDSKDKAPRGSDSV
ncbi:hypothetical protein RhiirA4_485617 [Rhizophagus irregularis]|uniref:Uncharacterized protein n=1 Tax=Rhizophagus irregularis TaxID=588596 RepID=A0A2I1HQC9_9GLOM|nr:hypothetical protein RhiirA4_485617 [Rhizophagus irregularis]